MLRMHVTQAEFRSFNEVCKQIAYACMCFLISSHILNLLHSSRGSLSSLLLRCKRALHFFPQLRHKNLMTLEIYMIITANYSSL